VGSFLPMTGEQVTPPSSVEGPIWHCLIHRR
jgi:hypothetical protein